MKTLLATIVVTACSSMMSAQITFNACHPLLEDQDYTINNVGTDATGRSIFEATPITGDQPCSGIGVCELRFAWNDGASQWEILADDGNGDFSGTFLLYSNSEASTPNPPSLNLGVWVENSAVTNDTCAGDLNTGNATLTGDVQDDTFGLEAFGIDGEVALYPNPMINRLNVRLKNSVTSEVALTIYTLAGTQVKSFSTFEDKAFDVSDMASGIYFIKLQIEDQGHTVKFIKR